MDLLLKLITQVEGADMRQNLVNVSTPSNVFLYLCSVKLVTPLSVRITFPVVSVVRKPFGCCIVGRAFGPRC